jgi:hypothetical protein
MLAGFKWVRVRVIFLNSDMLTPPCSSVRNSANSTGVLGRSECRCFAAKIWLHATMTSSATRTGSRS